MLTTPFIELLGYMDMKNQEDKESAREKEYERYLAFISACMASPYADAKAREDFNQSLMPQDMKEQSIKKLDWDFDMLKRMKSKSKGGQKNANN